MFPLNTSAMVRVSAGTSVTIKVEARGQAGEDGPQGTYFRSDRAVNFDHLGIDVQAALL